MRGNGEPLSVLKQGNKSNRVAILNINPMLWAAQMKEETLAVTTESLGRYDEDLNFDQ